MGPRVEAPGFSPATQMPITMGFSPDRAKAATLGRSFLFAS